jgi:hypothetical protein
MGFRYIFYYVKESNPIDIVLDRKYVSEISSSNEVIEKLTRNSIVLQLYAFIRYCRKAATIEVSICP